MSTQIIPTIRFDAARTSAGDKVPIAEQTQDYKPCIPHGCSNPFYRVSPPTGINVSEIAEHKISQLRDASVQKQTGELGRVYTTDFLEHIAQNDTFFWEIKNFWLSTICLFCAFVCPNAPN